jgi:predicted ATP-grasp superfamily ATP-dependent carboligase
MSSLRWGQTGELITDLAVTAVVLYAIKKVFIDKNGFLVGKDSKGKKTKIAVPVKPSGWQLINPKTEKPDGKVYKTKEEARLAYNKMHHSKKTKKAKMPTNTKKKEGLFRWKL